MCINFVNLSRNNATQLKQNGKYSFKQAQNTPEASVLRHIAPKVSK